MLDLDPFRCKSCNYVFVEPKIFMDRGSKVQICPFCGSRDIEKFTLALDADDLNLIRNALRAPLPDVPEEKLEGVRKKIDDALKLISGGEFNIRVKKSTDETKEEK